MTALADPPPVEATEPLLGGAPRPYRWLTVELPNPARPAVGARYDGVRETCEAWDAEEDGDPQRAAYEDLRARDPEFTASWETFRAIAWGLARHPDGRILTRAELRERNARIDRLATRPSKPAPPRPVAAAPAPEPAAPAPEPERKPTIVIGGLHLDPDEVKAAREQIRERNKQRERLRAQGKDPDDVVEKGHAGAAKRRQRLQRSEQREKARADAEKQQQQPAPPPRPRRARSSNSGPRTVPRVRLVPRPDARPEPELKAAAPQRGPGSGKPSKLTPAMLGTALAEYVDLPRMSWVARQMWEHNLADCHGTYASQQGLAAALSRTFRKRGWLDQDAARRALQAGEHEHEPPRTRTGMQANFRTEPDVLAEALWLYYYEQLGFRRISRRLYPRVAGLYASEHSLGNSLQRTFRVCGYPRRDRVEATRAASYKHGLAPRGERDPRYRQWLKRETGRAQPQCEGVTKNGPHKGKRCPMPAVTGSKFCQAHEQERQQTRDAHLARMRARRNASMVPIEPFQAWLAEFVHRQENLSAAAAALGMGVKRPDPTLVTRMLTASRDTTIREQTVRKYLAAAGTGETFDQLYHAARAA